MKGQHTPRTTNSKRVAIEDDLAGLKIIQPGMKSNNLARNKQDPCLDE